MIADLELEDTVAQFPKCLLIVTAQVDPAVEADWSAWYDTVHLPDALACPGVLSGTRYVSRGMIGENNRGVRSQPEGTLYTTIYALSGPEAVETKEFLAMRGWAQFTPHVRSQTRVLMAP